MGWFGKGLHRGGIVPHHGRGNDPEPSAVELPALPALPALPDGYWFVVKRSGDAVCLSVERRGWSSFDAREILNPTEAKVRKRAMKMARDVHAHAGARGRAESVVKAFTK